MGVTADHIAWLEGRREGRRIVHVLLNISAIDVTEEEARGYLDRMIASLNT